MRKLFWLVLLIPLMGCMTGNQLKAEQSYYEAMTKMQDQRAAQPLFQLIAADKDKPIIMQNVASFTVFAPPQGENGPRLNQYVQKDYAAPWLNVLGQTLAIGLPWFGAYKMVEAVAGIPKANITQNTNSGNTTSTNTLSNQVQGTGNSTNLGSGTSTWGYTEAPVVVNPPVVVPPVVIH